MADLRERVARAMCRNVENGNDAYWCGFLSSADAVLAELGLTQAEPVAVVMDSEYGKWIECRDIAKLAPGLKLYAAPQPQAGCAWPDCNCPSSLETKRVHCQRLPIQIVENATPQAEPVAYVWQGVIGAMRRGQRAIDATLWSKPTGQAGVPLYAAPQPQPQASAENPVVRHG